MRVNVKCPHCQKQVDVTGDTGQVVTCPNLDCGGEFPLRIKPGVPPRDLFSSFDSEPGDEVLQRLLRSPQLDMFVRDRIPRQPDIPDIGSAVREELQDQTTVKELRREILSGNRYWLPLINLLAIMIGLVFLSGVLFDKRLKDAVEKHGIPGPASDPYEVAEILRRDPQFLDRVQQLVPRAAVAQAPTTTPSESAPLTPTLPTCAACLAECMPVMKTEVPGISDEDANTACSDETCKAGSTCQ